MNADEDGHVVSCDRSAHLAQGTACTSDGLATDWDDNGSLGPVG